MEEYRPKLRRREEEENPICRYDWTIIYYVQGTKLASKKGCLVTDDSFGKKNKPLFCDKHCCKNAKWAFFIFEPLLVPTFPAENRVFHQKATCRDQGNTPHRLAEYHDINLWWIYFQFFPQAIDLNKSVFNPYYAVPVQWLSLASPTDFSTCFLDSGLLLMMHDILEL